MAIHLNGETRYEGAVLADRERNYHDDSDFYAIVWDGEKITTVDYDTTRFAGGGSCEVDVTEETLWEMREYLRDRLTVRWNRDNHQNASEVRPGRQVRQTSARARKFKNGRTGWVGWCDTYHSGYNAPKPVCTLDTDPDESGRRERLYNVATASLEVIDSEQYETPTTERDAMLAERLASPEAIRQTAIRLALTFASPGCLVRM